ncbi:MAG: hypothetical protein RUMPE_00043 [Eubacteriales bacterium SKADARSKE-1]|nr:hypothetical protein [Eubacteriales bacterium SKADARSKE-1]
MADSLVKTITLSLTNMPPELVIFLISVLPILELRGGLIAASILGVDWRIAFPICVAGNLLPLPFILLFIDKIFAYMKKTRFAKVAEFFEKKANSKSKSVLKYKEWGLFAFVAVPLPGTGGWTGALIAALLRFDLKRSMIIVSLGVVTAGVIMSIASYVIPSLCFNR